VNEVLAGLRRRRADLAASRPFLLPACSGCYHDRRCLPQLEAAGDLSLVHGMSHGARTILEGLGCRTVTDLATFHPEGARARGNLDPTLVRRLRRSAQAHLLGKPLVEERPRGERQQAAALLHLLADPFADRVLAFGLLSPAREDGAFTWERTNGGGDEWAALKRLLVDLPPMTRLLHFGDALPRWYSEHAFAREADPALEARFVDLQPRLRTAAIWPRPTFGLPDYVRHGLGRDPHRAGHAGAAAMWAGEADAAARFAAKLRSDLHDLAALRERVLEAAPTADPAADATGADRPERPFGATAAGA
jgi:predicted RecB family nuclease